MLCRYLDGAEAQPLLGLLCSYSKSPSGRSSGLILDSDVQIAAFLRDWARKNVPEAFDGRTAE
jgi:hypothetical protein